jgi:hypothetical protein
LPGNTVSIENFPSPQITIASSSDKFVLFLCLCAHHFGALKWWRKDYMFVDIRSNGNLKR